LIHSLILGRDATLGKNRAGGPEAVKTVTETLNFPVTYLEDFTVNNERVSSSRIRNLILEGKLTEAGVLLGRRYSIYAPVIQGEGKGKALGFPTANISVKELCLPPCGVYAATCRYQNRDYRAIANLGVAPTLKDMTTPLLEVHILDQTLNLYGESVEIFLDHYIRPEQRFTGVDSLKQQIAHDIATCRKLPIKLG
jgi:riboflavin kinase/FMN adenylyltransferase